MDADRIVEQYLQYKASPAIRTPSDTTRGLRNNNPGNIRGADETWQGQTGVDYGGMCVFESAHYGLRALAKILLVYHNRYGLSTVAGIISRWAPPNENNTVAYIADVCKDTSFDKDAWLRLGDASVLGALVRAIVHQENGQQPFDDAEISGGVQAALT